MIRHVDLEKSELLSLIRKRKVGVAGNVNLKIYGTLHCRSGKRMKKVNRVFFTNAAEAELGSFRPCAHCMNDQYQKWKSARNRLN